MKKYKLIRKLMQNGEVYAVKNVTEGSYFHCLEMSTMTPDCHFFVDRIVEVM